MRCITLIFVFMIFSFKINAQFGLKKNHILTAYNTIKTTANFPKTWSLSDYEVYSGKRDRKCIDIAIIEINALNGFGVPINSSFLCYFIRGRMFWYMKCEYKPSFLKLFTEKSANQMIDLAVNTSIEIERTISKEELCKSSKEEEEERLNQEKRKEEERLEALRKIEAEKARIELEEKTKVAQSKIEGLISEHKYELASQFYSTNYGTYDLNNYYDAILNGLTKTFENDTIDLSKEIVNDFITNNKNNLIALNSGDYEFLFNTEGAFSLGNKRYSISKNIPVKIVGRYFKVPLPSKMKISITEIKDLTTKIEYNSSSKKPIFNRNDNQFFYKTKSSLPLCQFEMDPSLPKNVIRSKRFLETIKKANGIVLFEEKKTTSNDYIINKKE